MHRFNSKQTPAVYIPEPNHNPPLGSKQYKISTNDGIYTVRDIP